MGPGDCHALPPYPRHNLAPKPRNTSTSWNSEPPSLLLQSTYKAFPVSRHRSALGLGVGRLELVERLVGLGSVLSPAHPLDVFVACQVLQSFLYLNFYSFYFACCSVLAWSGQVSSLFTHPDEPSLVFVAIIGADAVTVFSQVV